MRITYVVAIACCSVGLGLLAGRQLPSAYANAAAFPLNKAHCVFDPVVRTDKHDIPGILVTLVPRSIQATMWLVNANTTGPDAQITKLADGTWTAAAVFTVAPGAAIMTVNAEKRALLSIHTQDLGWSTQVGHCLSVELKAST